MRRKLFLFEYFLDAILVAASYTNSIPIYIFLPLFAAILMVLYLRDGLQPSTLYYIPLAIAMLIGQALEIPHTNACVCAAVIYLQTAGTPIFHLPENKKLVGFRKQTVEEGKEEYFEFYPIKQETATQQSMNWNQGRAFQKIIDSKEVEGIVLTYYRIALSYIKRMKLKIGSGQERLTKCGMALCHGRDAAPLWYSSLLIHFASNGFKAGARQHANLARLGAVDKDEAKKLREEEAKRTAEEYYSVIVKLNSQKLILVGHSFGCSALLQAYHDHSSELSSKVTHIILLDPYLFPLPDHLLIKPLNCPVLVLANQYLLNFEDVNERFRIFTSKKNVKSAVWKDGSDLYQTDLCFLLGNSSSKPDEWEAKFQMNMDAINGFMMDKQSEGAFGDKDLGKQYKPEEYYPEKLFIF